MPGPRAKQNGAKKSKHKAPTLNSASSASTSASTHFLDSQLDGLSINDWNKVAIVLCSHLKLPDLTTRSGLKKVYHNFSDIYKRIEDVYDAYKGNQVVRGGIVAIYVKMSADAILRSMIFHQGQILTKIINLIDKPSSQHLALQALTTVTKHGGSDIRKEISLQTPVLVKLLQDFPDDMYTAELAITTIAHAVSCSLVESQKPAAKYVKALQLSKLIPLVLGFVRKPGVPLPLLHHALELFGHLTDHCSQECLNFPDMVDFLIACIRSADMHSRFYALGAVIRLGGHAPDKITGNPRTLIAAVERGLPRHLEDLLLDYGPFRTETTLTLHSTAAYQNAMMQCAQDRDLYRLGLKLAQIIPQNEFAISEGGFQSINERTGKMEFIDVGLPFKRWIDALPLCADAIRKQGRRGEERLADMLDMKFFITRSRYKEAIAVAKEGIERDPSSPYPYYVMTLGEDEEAGLRNAKKGLKCTKNVTAFVNHALRARATEIAGNLALCRMQESAVGDRRWEQAQAFLTSALDDAHIYLAQAPPDMRHRKSILYWDIVLTLAKDGPELSTDLHEFDRHIDGLKIADEFFAEFGIVPPKSQLRMAQERIFSRYSAATSKWGTIVARLDSGVVDEFILSRDKNEDRFAAWLGELTLDDGDAVDGEAGSMPVPRFKSDPKVLYRCSWCGNPSAVLRKCAGCEKARYCDSNCQKLAWTEHKPECKSR